MRRGTLAVAAAVVIAARPTTTASNTLPGSRRPRRPLALPTFSLPTAALSAAPVLRAAPLRRQRYLHPSTAGQRASYFTDGKRSFARGTAEEQQADLEAAKKAGKDLLKTPVDADGKNIMDGRHMEDLLPSRKQLNDELPSAQELERALREGKMDAYTLPRDKDEE